MTTETTTELAPLGSGQMFDQIARRYDFVNRVLSFGMDIGWRKRAVRALQLGEQPRVLDLATGTGDLAIDIARMHPGATVVGLDPSKEMLAIAQAKLAKRKLADRVSLVVGDAQELPYRDCEMDAATIAFGIRNVPDRSAALREMARVVRPGGRIAILELGEPRRGFMGGVARIHTRHVVPKLGRVRLSPALDRGIPAARGVLHVDATGWPPRDRGRAAVVRRLHAVRGHPGGGRMTGPSDVARDDRRLPVAPPLAEPAAVSLEHALALAMRADGLTFVALRAPVVPAHQLVRAWPDATAVAWTSHHLTIAGIGIARELRGRGATRWADVIAGARALRIAGAVFVDDLDGQPEPAVESSSEPAIRRRSFASEPSPSALLPIDTLGIARPRLLGGAAFSPGAADAAPWTGFGDAWFVLPRWTYVHDGKHGFLVLAVSAADADDLARWRDELATHRAALTSRAAVPAPSSARVIERASCEEWRTRIESITRAIGRGDCSKIVAARTCVVELDDGALEIANPVALDKHMLDRAYAAEHPSSSRETTRRGADLLAALDARHPDCVRVLVRPPGAGTLIAASPERLVRREGDTVECDALAGTVRLGESDAGEAAKTLLASHKDRREHELVVTAIRAALEGVGARVSAPNAPEVKALRHVLHLHTPFRARLDEPTHVLELAARLHPTPAVGGTPTALAVDWIQTHEPVARGWYAAPVGWFDLAGNGELAVAIRSGLVAGNRAHLWAGAGIVAGSDPDRELAETELKLRAMLGALGAV
jgi:isochorismate synthase/ubiquinone/menaquinone biosynthesis methyltransferase